MSISVVLADDHAVLRGGLKSLLNAQADLTVVGTAANGREAVQLVSEICPTVVLMDMAMPEMNGIEATRQIRKHCPQVSVIMLSMHSSPEHVIRALQAGASGYVLKESASAEVIEAIGAVAAGRRYLGSEISDSVLDYYLNHHELDAEADPLAELTRREREVLQLVVEGRTLAEIGESLGLSVSTVTSYRSRMMRKLGIKSVPELVLFAIREGLIAVE